MSPPTMFFLTSLSLRESYTSEARSTLATAGDDVLGLKRVVRAMNHVYQEGRERLQPNCS